jgi:hypothetical protein
LNVKCCRGEIYGALESIEQIDVVEEKEKV